MGVFISSATIGDEPPQKRIKTACAADVDIVEKVCFLCVIINMILNTNSHPPTSLDGRSRHLNPHLHGRRQRFRSGCHSDSERAARRQCASRRSCHLFSDMPPAIAIIIPLAYSTNRRNSRRVAPRVVNAARRVVNAARYSGSERKGYNLKFLS